ncbi:MAG: CGNR zinc finger domain-containing protein [Acidimicrobiia bacterium]
MPMVVQSPPIEFLSEFVNTWAESVYHDPAPAAGRSFPAWPTFSERFGIPCAASASDPALARIAGQAYLVFAAPIEERLHRANECVTAAHLRPVLRSAPGLWWVADEALRIEALAAAALLQHARSDPTLARLGVCTAHRCRDAYIDLSQGATRRFCSERCQTRAKARRRRG